MKLINRFTVLSKRILSHGLYLCMLMLIVILTVIYQLLPTKQQSADIRVAVCCDDHDGYIEKVFAELERNNTLYKFYMVDEVDDVIDDVKSGYAECGFYIPDGFFHNYIIGNEDADKIEKYTTPSSTISAAILETFFANAYQICAEDMLLYHVNMPEYNEQLSERFDYYTHGDETFHLLSPNGEQFSFETLEYRVKIPVYEIVLILMFFGALLGLMMYQQDKEKRMYLALSTADHLQLKSMTILVNVLPLTVVGIISSLVIGLSIASILWLVIYGILFVVFAMLLSLIVRKSTQLAKLLPVLMLGAIILIFIKSII